MRVAVTRASSRMVVVVVEEENVCLLMPKSSIGFC